ncbi:MAG: HAMP domain-containing sensor histidine kinase [Mobilitalea sp.]
MKSIRTKLWLGMMVLVGIIIILLWLFQIVFLEKFYSVIELREVTKNANSIVREIEKLDNINEVGENTLITETMIDFVYEKQLSIEVIDTSYQIVYQNASGNSMNMPGMMKEVINEAYETVINGIEFKQEVTHPKFGYQFMIIGIPIYQDNVVQGAMLLTLPMVSVNDTADILKKQLIIITGTLLLVSLLISFRLSKNLADPISKISRLAESYAAGHYTERINHTGDDEIGQLAKRMNHMGEELVQNDILQKELIANVSHELRTPLTLIRGYAETLRDVTGNNPDKREKQLGIIIEESERLSKIVEDILNLSQLQAGAVVLEKESFSLNKMLLNIKDHYELQKETRTFQIRGASELKDNLVGDKKKIEQVFYNLINNAFRHTKEEELVEILVMQKPDHIRIEVKDQGEGIAKEDLIHIFERYYKGKRADGKKSSGSGLGLAIVKSILEMHQASYGVESELGKGTTFWFELKKDSKI